MAEAPCGKMAATRCKEAASLRYQVPHLTHPGIFTSQNTIGIPQKQLQTCGLPSKDSLNGMARDPSCPTTVRWCQGTGTRSPRKTSAPFGPCLMISSGGGRAPLYYDSLYLGFSRCRPLPLVSNRGRVQAGG
jgi:hypothetical protein